MKKLYKVIISALGKREETELKIGNETFSRENFDGVFTNYSKKIVGFRESRACLTLALCNAQGENLQGIAGTVINN